MFKLLSSLDGVTPPFEYYPVTNAEVVVAGEALVLTSGALTKCAATATPEFLAVKSTVTGDGTTLVPVMRITEQMCLETTMGAVNGTPAPVVVGTKLTLHTDGLSCSYVTTNGVFTLANRANTGNAVAGDVVSGYFRR